MQSFDALSAQFTERFSLAHFPSQPSSLYDSCDYFLKLGGKRVRPVLCLMGNEMFEDINPDTWHAATAIELFHNFTLIHDDIMDRAPLRRGMQTVHTKFGERNALLSGDVMLVFAYEYLNRIHKNNLHKIIQLFNRTAREVCEGQQLDIDYENRDDVTMSEYIRMIELKTSVLIAASLQMGAVLGGAGERNNNLLFDFGKKLGIAFQIQDDYLDAFGDPKKFGKQVGGDIMSNKKTFLLIHAMEIAKGSTKKEIDRLLQTKGEEKVEKMLNIFRECEVDKWALQLKNKYLDEAMTHLDDIAVLSVRKKPLADVANFLVKRDY